MNAGCEGGCSLHGSRAVVPINGPRPTAPRRSRPARRAAARGGIRLLSGRHTQHGRPRGPAAAPADVESTVELLNRARAGDAPPSRPSSARCLPPLRRWARGRLPLGARGALDTQDLVQDTVLNALQRLDQFESRHEGALQAYLRQAVLNRIRDEARKLARRPAPSELDDDQPVSCGVAAGHCRRPRGRRAVRSRAAAAPPHRSRGDRRPPRIAVRLRGAGGVVEQAQRKRGPCGGHTRAGAFAGADGL